MSFDYELSCQEPRGEAYVGVSARDTKSYQGVECWLSITINTTHANAYKSRIKLSWNGAGETGNAAAKRATSSCAANESND